MQFVEDHLGSSVSLVLFSERNSMDVCAVKEERRDAFLPSLGVVHTVRKAVVFAWGL